MDNYHITKDGDKWKFKFTPKVPDTIRANLCKWSTDYRGFSRIIPGFIRKIRVYPHKSADFCFLC